MRTWMDLEVSRSFLLMTNDFIQNSLKFQKILNMFVFWLNTEYFRKYICSVFQFKIYFYLKKFLIENINKKKRKIFSIQKKSSENPTETMDQKVNRVSELPWSIYKKNT